MNVSAENSNRGFPFTMCVLDLLFPAGGSWKSKRGTAAVGNSGRRHAWSPLMEENPTYWISLLLCITVCFYNANKRVQHH